MHSYTDADFWEGNGLEVFFSRSQSKNVTGWVHNSSNWWANEVHDCKDRSGKIMIPPKDDDRTDSVVDRSGNSFVLTGLQSRATYVVNFYDTRSTGKTYGSQTVKTGFFGRARLDMPVKEDCAFKAYRYYPGNF